MLTKVGGWRDFNMDKDFDLIARLIVNDSVYFIPTLIERNEEWVDRGKGDVKAEVSVPLVETPLDALKSFALGGFDAMYIQGWLIKKRCPL